MPERVFYPLQVAQKQHDEQFHPDIYYLDYPRRMTHFVLHFAKYAGRLAEMTGAPDPKRLEQTLADNFIVVLAASDVLNLDFDQRLTSAHGEPPKPTLAAWCAHVARGESVSPEAVPEWWMMKLVPPTGEMAKALESLDHMEPLNVREMLTKGLLAVLVSTLATAHFLRVDLEKLTRDRWDEVARRRLL